MTTAMYAEACSKDKICWQSADPYVDLRMRIPMSVR